MAGGILLLLQRRLFNLQLHQPPRDCIQLGGHGIDFGADRRASLIDQIDRLVGQKTVGNITMTQLGRRNQGIILNPHPVIDFETLFQPP